MLAQKSTSVKSFKYSNYLCPNPYTGKPIYGGETFEISYSSSQSTYGIDFKYGFMRYMLSISYKGTKNGWYTYTGFEIDSMSKVVVMTRTKLSDFLSNFGQLQDDYFEKEKLIEIHIGGSGSLSVYPLKNTPELQASMEKQAKEREKEKREKEELQLRKDTYEKLCSYTAKNEFNDSVKAFVLNKILENKSLFEKLKLKELSRKVDCIGCVESTGAIKIVKIGEYFLDDILFKEYSSQDNIRYATR